MCRFIAYQGVPIALETLVSLPAHSLIHQSTGSRQAVTSQHCDGFGLGWYGSLPRPETYHNAGPIGASPGVRSLCHLTRSASFFAHIRSATGTDVAKTNCHPFSHGRMLFMHNGQISHWTALRPSVEALLPTALHRFRRGTTDSEAIFLSAIADGLEDDPVAAMQSTLARLKNVARAEGYAGSLRFSAALTDGDTLWAFRWACDGCAPTLYFRAGPNDIVVASEPTDPLSHDWNEIPVSSCLVARRGGDIHMLTLQPAMPVTSCQLAS
ncbi:class II glutamine amidotransferase [Acidiphilium sp.]|uniref:class II glutamine amidotransferase n=1 Tax=Acidiphilium sp. TaxID=527 RepID=UPI0025827996|nr:class II glutamine amidotransferase [Acidiphilium sp.]